MQGLTGLTGLAAQQVDYIENPEATAEDRMGGTADPKHGNWGEQAAPYPWESSLAMGGSHGPYGPENQMLGDPEWVWESGGESLEEDPQSDLTPSHRAGPFPKGILSGPIPGDNPTAMANQREQSAEIHAINTGAARRSNLSTNDALQDQWVELWEINSGSTDLDPNIGRQGKSTGFMFGTRDRTHSFARQNQYGFDSKHMHRRYAVGSIPGNTYWLRPGGRPMAKTLPGPARPPIGLGSPFYGDSLGAAFGAQGAVLMTQPSEYQAPPQPYLAPATAQQTGDNTDYEVSWY